MGKTLDIAANQVSINVCNKVWDEKIAALEESFKKAISDCNDKWKEEQKAVMKNILNEKAFSQYELEELYRIHHFGEFLSEMHGGGEDPLNILDMLVNDKSGNISSWVAHRYDPDTNLKLFWWSIPIGLILCIWIPFAFLFIPFALIYCLIRNAVLTKRCDKLYESDKSFLAYEKKIFLDLKDGIQTRIEENDKARKEELDSMSVQHQADIEAMNKKRESELLAIKNNETTKYTTKSLSRTDKAGTVVW